MQAQSERARFALQRQKRAKAAALSKPEALVAIPIPPKPPAPPMGFMEPKILDHARQLLVRQHRTAFAAAKGAAGTAASMPRITRLLEAGAASLRIGRGGRVHVDTRYDLAAAEGLLPDLGLMPAAEALEKDPEAARMHEALHRLMTKL